MARVILGLMFFAALVLAIASVVTLARSLIAAPAGPAAHRPAAAKAAHRPKEDPMPDIMRNIAYVLLLMLLVGIGTGWLGAG